MWRKAERYDEIALFLLSDISLIKRYPEILYTFVIGGHTTKYKISGFLFVENHMVDIIQRFPYILKVLCLLFMTIINFRSSLPSSAHEQIRVGMRHSWLLFLCVHQSEVK